VGKEDCCITPKVDERKETPQGGSDWVQSCSKHLFFILPLLQKDEKNGSIN
jgi:hypothetical protein